MTFSVTETGKVKIKMIDCLKEMSFPETVSDSATASEPAAENPFQIDDSALLGRRQKKAFHTAVAKAPVAKQAISTTHLTHSCTSLCASATAQPERLDEARTHDIFSKAHAMPSSPSMPTTCTS